MRRTPEVQKQRILSAAIAAFARDGLEGARVDAIAAAADINKRMLYHYFGDKATLFDAALTHAAEQLRNELAHPPWRRGASAAASWQLLAGLAGTEKRLPVSLDDALDDWLEKAGTRDVGPRGIVVLALEMFEALLPELIETRLGPFESTQARHEAVAALANRVCTQLGPEPAPERVPERGPERDGAADPVTGSAHKPRIKLRPRIQSV